MRGTRARAGGGASSSAASDRVEAELCGAQPLLLQSRPSSDASAAAALRLRRLEAEAEDGSVRVVEVAGVAWIRQRGHVARDFSIPLIVSFDRASTGCALLASCRAVKVSAPGPLATSKRGAGRSWGDGSAHPRQSKSRGPVATGTTAFGPLGSSSPQVATSGGAVDCEVAPAMPSARCLAVSSSTDLVTRASSSLARLTRCAIRGRGQ